MALGHGTSHTGLFIFEFTLCSPRARHSRLSKIYYRHRLACFREHTSLCLLDTDTLHLILLMKCWWFCLLVGDAPHRSSMGFALCPRNVLFPTLSHSILTLYWHNAFLPSQMMPPSVLWKRGATSSEASSGHDDELGSALYSLYNTYSSFWSLWTRASWRKHNSQYVLLMNVTDPLPYGSEILKLAGILR